MLEQMAEITKGEIKELLKGQQAAADKRFDSVDKRLVAMMGALNQTIALLTHVSEKTAASAEKIEHIESVVDDHTKTLDKILKNSQDWKTEAASLRSAIKRHEEWIAQIAAKVGVDLKTE